MDVLFEWTETRHALMDRHVVNVTKFQCVEYIHEARMDVLYLQGCFFFIGVICVFSIGLKLDEY